ncbi:MAG: DUF4070 domain-containing protein, partial [Okeania sp. SIO2H7]|nr:DUF4070 domain-containing protein [Okeania sp. SIO2H7]
AEDAELMELMVAANFVAVFLGIETPDEDSLKLTKKFQNTRKPLLEAVETIHRSGLRVMSGFILGFDGEKPGSAKRIVEFVEKSAIAVAFFSMLQALPNTALWNRLEKEGRLLDRIEDPGGNQTCLPNFIPTRSVEELANDYVSCFWELYEPKRYLARVYRQCLLRKPPPHKSKFQMPTLIELRALATVCWRNGFKRNTRFLFWAQLFSIFRHNPQRVISYLSNCASLEHFIEYRQIVRDQIEGQLAELNAQKAKKKKPMAIAS